MTIRVKFSREKNIPEEFSLGFQERPTQGLALEAVSWFEQEKIPRERWTTAGLVGKFILGYQDRFKRKLASIGSAFFVEVVINLATLVTRVGMKDAVDAVEAVFHPRLKWVSSSHHKFLLNENNYARFIIPVMAEIEAERNPTAKGEQAEFRLKSGYNDEVNEVEEIDF